VRHAGKTVALAVGDPPQERAVVEQLGVLAGGGAA